MIRRLRSARGTAMVEFALLLPVFTLVTFGAVDFARAYYTAIEVTNAARSAVQYGAASDAKAGDGTGQQTAGTGAAANLTGLTVTPGLVCFCTANTGTASTSTPCTAAGKAACVAGVQHFTTFLTAEAHQTFNPISHLPGLPRNLVISRSARQRLVN